MWHAIQHINFTRILECKDQKVKPYRFQRKFKMNSAQGRTTPGQKKKYVLEFSNGHTHTNFQKPQTTAVLPVSSRIKNEQDRIH